MLPPQIVYLHQLALSVKSPDAAKFGSRLEARPRSGSLLSHGMIHCFLAPDVAASWGEVELPASRPATSCQPPANPAIEITATTGQIPNLKPPPTPLKVHREGGEVGLALWGPRQAKNTDNHHTVV